MNDELNAPPENPSIRDLTLKAHINSRAHGFWDDEPRYPSDPHGSVAPQKIAGYQLVKMALVASEIGEAIEEIRVGNQEKLAEELADIVIRVMDFAGGYGIDLQSAIIQKMEKNAKRPRMHGGKLA